MRIDRIQIYKLFQEKTNNTLLQLFRYGFVAIGAFMVDYGCYFVLSYLLDIHYLLSAIIGFTLGTITNYYLSKLNVFQGTPKTLAGEILLVFLISLVGLAILELALYLFTDILHIHYLISKLIATVIGFFWNFFGRKFFMYSKFFNILKQEE